MTVLMLVYAEWELFQQGFENGLILNLVLIGWIGGTTVFIFGFNPFAKKEISKC